VAEHLFIRLSERSDEAAVAALNADGHLLHGPETVPLMQVADLADGMQVTALLPAREVVSCLASVPAASQARLRQMLPYSLEDEFASDVADLHFAAGERNDDNDLAVSVIARDRLDLWLEVLKSAGIAASRICSEADAVPDTPGVVTLFLEGGKTLGRRPGGAPFAFEELDLTSLWRLLEAESGKRGDIDNVVLFADAETLAARGDEIEAWRPQIESLNVRELADGCLPKLAAGLVFQPGVNLRQGDYALRSSLRAMARPWRYAAGFALALIAFGVAGEGLEFLKLRRDENRLTAEATDICAQSYGSPQLSRCLVEMGRRLADYGQSTSSGGSGFLSTLAAIAGAVDDAMTINSISFRDRAVTLDLTTPNAAYLDSFDQELTASNRFALEPQNTTNEPDGRIRVRMRVVALNP
jgi:type II secretion system protein L